MELSIIIPVYNSEAYLKKCLESCLRQLNVKSSCYEIIVINDGSTDASNEIIKQYKANYPNLIKAIFQPNKGVSAARNVGIKMAKGDYIWFVDSDDWISKDAVAEIIQATKENITAVAISYIVTYEKVKEDKTVIMKNVDNGIDLLKYSNHNPAQFCIFKRLFLEAHNIQFCEGCFHEDIEFSMRAKYLAKDINVIKKPLYYFFQRSVSISRGNKNPKRAFDCLVIINNLYQFVLQNVKSEHRAIFAMVMSMAQNIALSIIIHSPKDLQLIFIDKMRNNNGIKFIAKYDNNFLHKIEFALLSKMPNITISLYSFIKKYLRR